MEKYTVLASESVPRNAQGNAERFLANDVIAFYHEDYHGSTGNWKKEGTIENLICTFKNDITRYTETVLQSAMNRLEAILQTDLPEILRESKQTTLRVCVVPRAKNEKHYQDNQRLFRKTVQCIVQNTPGLEDGTHDILRHTDTATTHLSRRGHVSEGKFPYIGITKDTCAISDSVSGKDILLIDDLYTKTVNIDEDCIQALFDKGARSVIFYSVGKTVHKTCAGLNV